MSPHRPRKSFIGNVILVTAFAVVVFVVVQNFRVLQSTVIGRSEHPLVAASQEQQHQDLIVDLDDESIHTFVVWTYPAIPDDILETELAEDEVLLCSYPPCGTSLPSQRLNLKKLAQNTIYQDFVANHTLHKVAQKKDYLHHVQSVALLSLVRPENGKRRFLSSL